MSTDVLVFDVNETMLDLAAMRPAFVEALGSAEPMGEWFARLLHGSLVANHIRRYRAFGDIAADALEVVATRRGINLAPGVARKVASQMTELPPHPDVADGLRRLAGAGYRLVTLTNGSAEAAERQLAHAGIASMFERRFTVDEVELFKPAPEPYLHVAALLDVDIDHCMMVASHDWDLLGARSVGMQQAFVARRGVVWGMPDTLPDLVVNDFTSLADRLEELAGNRG